MRVCVHAHIGVFEKSNSLLRSINNSIRVSTRVNCLTWSRVPGTGAVAIAELKQTIRQRNFILKTDMVKFGEEEGGWMNGEKK